MCGLKSMKFYYIWVEIFSFELKKKNKMDIKNKNMSPKNAIKMINIQVLFGPHWLYLVYSFLFGPYGPNMSY